MRLHLFHCTHTIFTVLAHILNSLGAVRNIYTTRLCGPPQDCIVKRDMISPLGIYIYLNKGFPYPFLNSPIHKHEGVFDNGLICSPLELFELHLHPALHGSVAATCEFPREPGKQLKGPGDHNA